MAPDWVAGKEPADCSEMIHQLKEIVETWQAVMLYSSAVLQPSLRFQI